MRLPRYALDRAPAAGSTAAASEPGILRRDDTTGVASTRLHMEPAALCAG